MTDLFDEGRLAATCRRIDEWLATLQAENPAVEAAGRDDEVSGRWFVRLAGEAKAHTTIWLTVGQRTLRYETYVMPAPVDNAAQVYELALRRNEKLVGAHFSIGVEDALFLRGELPLAALDGDELDRIIGSLYAYVEDAFPGLVRLGHPRHFA
jgi:Putative bacterial sensory transduction regulator